MLDITHTLKILPCYFDAVGSGVKSFEIRRNNDRGFQKGDVIKLRECSGRFYSGRFVFAEITYVTNFEQREDYVVFGIKLLEAFLDGK